MRSHGSAAGAIAVIAAALSRQIQRSRANPAPVYPPGCSRSRAMARARPTSPASPARRPRVRADVSRPTNLIPTTSRRLRSRTLNANKISSCTAVFAKLTYLHVKTCFAIRKTMQIARSCTLSVVSPMEMPTSAISRTITSSASQTSFPRTRFSRLWKLFVFPSRCATNKHVDAFALTVVRHIVGNTIQTFNQSQVVVRDACNAAGSWRLSLEIRAKHSLRPISRATAEPHESVQLSRSLGFHRRSV